MVIIGGRVVPGPQGAEVEIRSLSGQWFTSRDLDTPSMAIATEFMLHETAGPGDPVPTLLRRKLGVHLVLEPSGLVRQHGDLLAFLEHVGSHNRCAIGIEVINPYYPSLRPRKGPWENVIDAPWAHHLLGKEKGYVVPTPAQAEACAQLADWLTSRPHDRIQIDWHWPGRSGSDFILGPIGKPTPAPGVWAHHQVGGHADGAWLALYTWLRLVAQLSPDDAYAVGMARATAVKNGRVKVADLIPRIAQEDN